MVKPFPCEPYKYLRKLRWNKCSNYATFISSETTQISKNWNVARAIKFSVIVKFEVYRVFSSHNTLLQQRRCLVIMKDYPEESDIADSNF